MAAPTSDIAGSLVSLTKQQAMVMLESVYLLMDLGKWDEAREVAMGAVALMPKSEVPHLTLGTLEFNQGRFDKALQSFRAAQRANDGASAPRAHAAEALLAAGKVGEAVKDLKAALELEPSSDAAAFAATLIFEFPHFYLSHGNIPKARELAKAGTKLLPAFAQPHYVLGLVEFEAGEFETSRAAFEGAVARDPNSSWARAYLGAVQLALGDHAGGAQTLKAAKDLEPADGADFAQKMLSAMKAPPSLAKGKR